MHRVRNTWTSNEDPQTRLVRGTLIYRNVLLFWRGLALLLITKAVGHQFLDLLEWNIPHQFMCACKKTMEDTNVTIDFNEEQNVPVISLI